MQDKDIKKRLIYLRKQAYKKEGSYEDSYAYLMSGLDRIIGLIN